MDHAREIIDRADRLRADRAVFDAHWQEIRDYLMPMAAALTRRETPGMKTHGQVLDNTGEMAAEMLAGALIGILTPDTVDWFALRATNERVNGDREAAGWLEDCAARMLTVFRSPRAGFASAQHEKYLDVVNFGTGAMFIADSPGKGILFTTLPLRQVLLAESGEGRVDTVYRDFTLSARQAVQRWQGQAGEKVLKAAADPKRQDTEFRFVHAVYPRAEHKGGKGDAKSMPYASVYVSVEDKAQIAEGGFHEMPFVTPRWSKRADETYGRSPGMRALADVKSLQRGMRITIKGGEKMVDPPLMVADDGVLSPVRVSPSALNFYRSGSWSMDPIKPLLTGGRPDIGEDLMQGIRLRIENAFLKPLIQMIRRDRMTATEVLQVAEEGQRILGPYLGRLKSEDLGPMIERVFGIMLRIGAFRPMPEVLQGQEIEIEYVSPAVKAQRVARARGLAQFGEITMPLVQMDPALTDNLDADQAYRDTADILGLPTTWVRSPEQVQAMRQARQEAQRQQQEMAAAAEVTDMATKVAGALPAVQQLMQGGGRA